MKCIVRFALFVYSCVFAFGGCDWTATWGANHFTKTGENANGVKITVEDIWLSKNKRAKLYVDGDYKPKTIEITPKDLEDIQKDCNLIDHKWPQDLENKLQAANSAGVAGLPLSISMAAFSSAGSDLNGDEIGDSVTINLSPPGVNVTLSRANGTFATPVRYTTGPGGEALLLADFNGDQILDIAVAMQGQLPQNSGGLAILLGAANGTFQAAVNYGAGVRPVSLTAGDLNGDGKLDLAVANAGSNGFPGVPDSQGGVSILLGNGNGTFQSATQLTAGNSPASILAAHLNADQNLDLVVANNQSANLSVFHGLGGGAFQAPVNTTVGERPTYLGVAEFNGDAIADIAVLHRGASTISIWLGNADGTLRANGRYLAGVRAESFAIVPIEGFTRPTILSPDAARARILMMHVDLDGTLVGPRTYLAGVNATSVAAADFNRDGKADAVTGGSAGLMVWRNQNGVSLADPVEIALPNSTSIAAADFTGDGNPDIAVANTIGISLLAGRGDGTFLPHTNVPGAQRPYFLTHADLNGDGARDLIAVNEGTQNQGTLSVYRGNGSGGFQAIGTHPLGFAARSAATADFNNDGRLDIVGTYFGDLGSNRGGARLYLQGADGSFQPGSPLDTGLSMPSVAAGDFNGDGNADLVTGGQVSSSPNFVFGLSIMLGNGNGTFQARTTIETGFGPSQITAGDFDGDGVQDLVVAHCCGDTDLALLRGNGDGTFRIEYLPGGSDPAVFAVGDFNGDLRPDLAVIGLRNGFATRGTLAILENELSPFLVLPATETAPRSVAPDSIVSIYGAKLANATAAAPSAAWPMSLSGTTVKVTDDDGVTKDAAVAFASSGQLNIHLPPGLKPGFATVSVTSAGGGTRSTQAILKRVVPGLFFVNADFVVAAYILRVRENGEQSLEPVVTLNASNQVVAAPISFGPATDRLYLLLYGTGLRNGSATKVTVGGQETTMLYAGAQGEYPGLDQVNVELPRSLAGAGLVDIVLETDGQFANTVKIRFQ